MSTALPLTPHQPPALSHEELAVGAHQAQQGTCSVCSGLREPSGLSMTMTSHAPTWPMYPLLVNYGCGELWSLSSIPSATGWTPDQLRSVVVVASDSLLTAPHHGSRSVFSNEFVGLADFSTYLLADSFKFDPGRQLFGVDPAGALSDLAEWTSLPTARLGRLLGVARRSIYNWASGKPVRPEIQTRLGRVHDALQPIAARYEPDAVRQWLDEGRPTNFELITDQQWSTVARRAQALLEQQKVRRIDDTTDVQTHDIDSFSDAVRAAVLTQFSTQTNREQARRSEWAPREFTGVANYEDDDVR